MNTMTSSQTESADTASSVEEPLHIDQHDEGEEIGGAESIETILEKAVDDSLIPGAVLVANSADGKFKYEKPFGVSSLTTKKPMELDTIIVCVERGQLELDADVTTVLPELRGREILTGFDEGTGEPILKPNTKILTLRHLLTHQSGLNSEFFSPLLRQYRQWQIRTTGHEISFQDEAAPEAHDFPLLHALGDSWDYGSGLLWAGTMVERVNGHITLEQYLKKNIWDPLGIESMSFHPSTNPEIKARLAEYSMREGDTTAIGTAKNPNGKVVPSDGKFAWPETETCDGGSGCYGSVSDFAKFLHALSHPSSPLLSNSTISEMFAPQLTPAAKAQLAVLRKIAELNTLWGEIPLTVEADWGIGGIMNLEAYPERSKGSISWGGLPNLHWLIDREKGFSGILGTQIIPAGDQMVARLNKKWWEEIHKRVGAGVV